MSCIFCDIINKKILAHIVYEDDDVMVFMPKKPEVEGHLLVVPKKHYTDIFEISTKELGKTTEIAQKMCIHLRRTLGIKGANILHASGKDAQQSVFHFHLHIIPRFENDELDTWPKFPCTSFDKDKLLEKILMK